MSGFAFSPSRGGGAHVLGTSIWCDVSRARGACFFSRADAGVTIGRSRERGRAAQAISSERTASLRRALGWPGGDALVPRFARPFALGRARLELLPAGGLPGAAQLLVELDEGRGGWRGLYAGVLAREVGGEPAQVRACDDLVLAAPQAGGVADPEDALEAAASGGGPLLFEDLLALFGLVARLGRDRVSLPPRWTRALGRTAAAKARGGGRKTETRVRLLPLDPTHVDTILRRAATVSGDATLPRRSGSPQRGVGIEEGARGGRVVRAGLRPPGEDSIALGLHLGVDELARVAVECEARRVHLVLEARDPLRDAGARALAARLRGGRSAPAVEIVAQLARPAEQLTLV